VTQARDIFIVANSATEMGGVARWAHQMAGLFSERGHRVTVVGIVPPPEGQELALAADLPYDVVTLHDVHPGGAVWNPNRTRDRLLRVQARRQESARQESIQRAADKLSALFRAARPGGMVIVAQIWAMEWVVRADTAGLPVIGMSHESFAASKASSRFARVQKYYADADRLVLLTTEDSDQWIRQGMNRATAIPNPTPVSPDAEPSPRAAKTVVSVGRLSREKGFDLLLEAWAEAAPSRPDWRLRIYGSGEAEASLRAYCTELGLDDSVEFAGQTQDVPGALREGSVFAQASRAEGFPLTLLEAMSCGLPCVAFDCAPGVHEIVTDEEDGLLARPGSTMELARKLGRLMDDQALRDEMGERARKSVQRFAPDVVVSRWEELFGLLER